MQYSRWQTGGSGVNTEEFKFICVHVMVDSPINLNPELQM